jgi:hypothetical protein
MNPKIPILVLGLMLLLVPKLKGQKRGLLVFKGDCSSHLKTIQTLTHQEGILFLHYGSLVIRYKKGKLIPCNMLDKSRYNCKILFSGKIKEGDPAVKAFGSIVTLTQVVYL